jgi:RNA polymerase sigma factor (sigma-70 family)
MVSPTVFVVEDDERIRRPLTVLLAAAGYQTSEFSSAEQFLQSYNGQPGCIVLDIRLEGSLTGLDLQDELRRRGITIPVIFISAYGDVATTVRAMRAGALNFLQKPFNDEELIESVRAAVEQDLESFERRQQFTHGLSLLSKREVEVMKLLIEPLATKQIANRLGISPKTVEKHRANLLLKMGADSVVDLVCRFRPSDESVDQSLANGMTDGKKEPIG